MSISLKANSNGSGSILISGVERAIIGTDGSFSTVTGAGTSPAVVDPNSSLFTFSKYKNRLINGNFDIWQRGTSLTMSNGAFTYLADRWRVSSSGTSTVTTRQPFQTSSTLVDPGVPNNPTYYHRSVVTSVAGANNFSILDHLIEGVDTLSGQNATLTFWAKANATKSLGVHLLQFFGGGGSPSSAVLLTPNTATLSTTWTKFTYTFSIPSINGKVIGTTGGDCLVLRFAFDAGTTNAAAYGVTQQSGTFDIAQVQLTSGSTASDFEVLDLATTQKMCDRYYQAFGLTDGALTSNGALESIYNTTGTLAYRGIALRQRMRKVPTVTASNGAGFNNTTGISVNSITIDAVNIQWITTTLGGSFVYYTFTANAEF